MSIDEEQICLKPSIVGDFYNKYPFPAESLQDGPPPGCNWRWCVDNVYAFCTGALPSSLNAAKKIRILDAGCGTGVSTDYLAHLNPGSEILAIDISSSALDIASQRLKKSGAIDKSKIYFEKSDLLECKDYGLFDYINSVGVIHHLDNPLEGLKALRSMLKPGAILHLFLYAEGGRFEIKRAQRVLKSLGASYSDNGLLLGRELFSSLPKNNMVRINYEKRWKVECIKDEVFADMYLHPKEINFNLNDLRELLSSAKLDFIRFSNPQVWDVSRFFSGDLLERARSLSEWQQWQLVEALDTDISHFEFFVSRGPCFINDLTRDEVLLSSNGKINQCFSGWPSKTLHDSDFISVELSANDIELLSAIDNSPIDTPLGQLDLGWERCQIASIARKLIKKQVLLLFPS